MSFTVYSFKWGYLFFSSSRAKLERRAPLEREGIPELKDLPENTAYQDQLGRKEQRSTLMLFMYYTHEHYTPTLKGRLLAGSHNVLYWLQLNNNIILQKRNGGKGLYIQDRFTLFAIQYSQ